MITLVGDRKDVYVFNDDISIMDLKWEYEELKKFYTEVEVEGVSEDGRKRMCC